MKTVNGLLATPAFDSVDLRELRLDLNDGTQAAVFALVKAKTGDTYGQTELISDRHFRSETRKAMGKAIALMEEDALKLLFPNTKEDTDVEQRKGSPGLVEGPAEGSQL